MARRPNIRCRRNNENSQDDRCYPWLEESKYSKKVIFTMLESDKILFSLVTIYVNDILPFPLLDVHRLHISRMFVGNQNTETKNSIAKNRE